MNDPLDTPRLALLAPVVAKANLAIESKVADARAHAERSLTQAVIEAEEGRATIRTLRGQRSFQAAKQRLEDLRQWLAPLTVFRGYISGARARFYRDAHGYWKAIPELKEALKDASPTISGERKSRSLVLFGVSPNQKMNPLFITAQNSLQTAVNSASIDGMTSANRQALLDRWEEKTAKAICSAVEAILSNSQVAIYTRVGRDLVRKDLRRAE